MPIRFTCPTCQTPITAPDTAASQQAPCPNCGTPVTAPPAPATPAFKEPERIPDCHLLAGWSGFRSPWLIAAVIALAALVVIAVISRCGPSHGAMLSQVSGVWTCASDNALVTIDYSGNNKVITVNDKVFPVAITQLDTDNDAITFDVSQHGQPILWTLKQERHCTKKASGCI